MTNLIWQPQQHELDASWMMQFWRHSHQNAVLNNYSEIHQWSIEHREQFWEFLIDFFDIKYSKKWHTILQEPQGMFMAKWFDDCELNFAENLLRYRDDKIAINYVNELGASKSFRYQDLYQKIAILADALRRAGLTKGDRVAAILPNIPDTIVAMLACTSIGAIWSCCSPEFGASSIIERFEQIEPKVILYCDCYYFKGKKINISDKIYALKDKLNPEYLILIRYPTHSIVEYNKLGVTLESFTKNSSNVTTIKFEQLPFNHPIYILYSSGTTGIPKCIVHGAGGTLLQHYKELALHTNIKRDDKLFYYTTTGWMMWNWQLSALALGATVVLYDGSPFFPTMDNLLKVVANHQVTVFGCSAKYLDMLNNNNICSDRKFKDSALRSVLSTGSTLLPQNYDYIKNSIKSDVQICSISGGTDIVSCFALGNPISKVYRGELQGIGLAMDVKIFNAQAEAIRDKKGELVCCHSFPSMPVYFWNDPNNKKYHSAYFEQFKGVWAHGDYAKIKLHDNQQSLVIYGRSDATLNPGGVRIGTAEIYKQLDQFGFIEDGIVVAQTWQGDQRIILFVVLKNRFYLDDSMIATIKETIRFNTSPFHVPEKIIQIHDIPRTYNGKIAELAVRNVIHDLPVDNLSALVNPESLQEYKHIRQLQ
ncbi:Acetoacetyl-CoA synthetase [hydrothermal vent metagenome]|uniref:Acetoacetyl-CoA synthetase n=1 Tax=hydrothermal vent metagenome TaxID=652676 RepID=A0A3B1AZY4_9ZZZZ